MTKKKLFGHLAQVGLGLLPGGNTAVAMAKLGGEIIVGELLLKDDDEKEQYRTWYWLAAALRDNDKLTNAVRKDLLLGRIESDLVAANGEVPGETDLMFYFYMIVRDVKGGFETADEE